MFTKGTRRRMTVFTVVVTVPFLMANEGCDDSTANRAEREVVNRQQEHYSKTQPVPFYPWSLDREVLQQVYNLKNKAFTTYSVFVSQGTGNVAFECASRGYPTPADTQLTNPLAVQGGSGVAVEQAEPNGTFTSKNTNATYVLCIRGNGDVVPVYSENSVMAFPFEVEVDENGRLREVVNSPSTGVIKLPDSEQIPDPQYPDGASKAPGD